MNDTPDPGPNPDGKKLNAIPIGKVAAANRTPEVVNSIIPPAPDQSASDAIHQKKSIPYKPTIDDPFVVRVSREDELSNFEKQIARYTGVGVVVSFLSLLATILAAIIFYMQFQQMSLQSAIASDDALRARITSRADSKTAAKQLAALQVQIDDSEGFFRIDERAWIVISSVKLKETVEATETSQKHFIFTVVPKNVGKTVATGVQIHIISPVRNVNFLIDREAIIKAEDKDSHHWLYPTYPGPQTLAPNAAPPVPLEQTVMPPQGPAYGFILGRIDYVDVFSVPHWVHFCYFVKDENGYLGHCMYGNDQDTNTEERQH